MQGVRSRNRNGSQVSRIALYMLYLSHLVTKTHAVSRHERTLKNAAPGSCRCLRTHPTPAMGLNVGAYTNAFVWFCFSSQHSMFPFAAQTGRQNRTALLNEPVKGPERDERMPPLAGVVKEISFIRTFLAKSLALIVVKQDPKWIIWPPTITWSLSGFLEPTSKRQVLQSLNHLCP